MASVYSAPRSLFHKLWYEPPPSLAVEFSAGGVAAARWTPGLGTVDRFTSEALPEGALRPSPVRENIVQPDQVRQALAAALGRVSRKSGGRLAVFLPDVAARVFVIPIDQLPVSPEDARSLIRWRLRKTVPFEIEDALLDYQRQGDSRQGQEVVVAAAPRAVARQYEAALESLGCEPTFITLSSLAALGLIPQSESRRSATMLLRGAGRLLTIIVTTMGRLGVFRSTELPAGEETRPVEETVADVYTSAVFFQDNYGGVVERIFLAGFGAQTRELQESVERELNVRPQPLLVPGARGEEVQFLGCYGMIAEQAKE